MVKQDIDRLHKSHKKQLLVSLIVVLCLVAATILVVLYGTGYRLGFQEGKPQVAKTGILAVSSIPNGAQVYLDNKLTTATDSNLDLTPGVYKVKIEKEGYFSYEREVKILEKEVTQINAMLFPIAPKLEAITTTGAKTPIVNPKGSKLAYNVDTQSFQKNGIYIYDMTANILIPIQGESKQLADDSFDVFSNSHIKFSPDSKEIVASIAASTELGASYYKLDPNTFNSSPQDITSNLSETEDEWATIQEEIDKALTSQLKSPVRLLVQDYFNIISYSPDENKILYTAKKDGSLPIVIRPRRIGIQNTIKETRNVSVDKIYVYNIKEDINTFVSDKIEHSCKTLSCRYPINWHSDSVHLVYVNDGKIDLLEYDGQNRRTIYAGPFDPNYVFSWPDASRIVILTDLNNPQIPKNLYTISLK